METGTKSYLENVFFDEIIRIKIRIVTLFLVVFFSFCGCSGLENKLNVNLLEDKPKIGDILDLNTGEIVNFDCMIKELAKVPIVYLGEQHSNHFHHVKQLKIIEALFKLGLDFKIGMEMFDSTYQDVLSLWVNGPLIEKDFLKFSHWYANWRFDYGLYRDIMNFSKKNKLEIVGLNIPFHIPAKISIGGIGSLLSDDRKYLPPKSNLTCDLHKKYIKDVYDNHHIPGRIDFEFFYEAQCIWEDTMADNIVKNFTDDKNKIVVLVGNGHVARKMGIPDRVREKAFLFSKTVCLVPIGDTIKDFCSDYVMFTDSQKPKS